MAEVMALLQVQIPDDLKIWLKVYAAKHGTTMSEITEQALEQWREQQKTIAS